MITVNAQDKAHAKGREAQLVLSVNDVKKKIGNRLIIKGISFDVYAGEIFGFLGPNGSGKTTTIRMLVDLIRPTEGSIRICGYDVQKEHNEALQYVGCIVENPELYGYLSGWENLEHFARMLPGITDQRIREVVDIVGMDQRIHDKVKTYSLGMRQRLGIAQALLNDPKLLILDEPTNGLDPQGIKELREFIRKLADSGLSLFISSHLLSEIQQMCDRVAIISQGEVIKVGEVSALVDESASTVVWSVQPIDRALYILKAEPEVVIFPGGNQASSAGETGTGAIQPQIVTQMNLDAIPDVSRRMVEAGVRLYGIEIKNPTLEDLFLKLTEGERIG
ncbi:ABC transporter ATP-binding protein [Paenibacillus naphthalenovorans]|uniref:ABC transporter ATP-binding protein n=1 Tax=Paenibacillus naphthalenovorans TaxID=162209 RepID=A0A0U2WB91_9BACL|nr:ABC transporter ATP-binding protein [Paenibacillus naphthalenovorans]ALS22618.1 ABC transporter ATP-binding protein [Paenibacillus naphthalenovorans]GCL70414.1 ABC transporter ATP-binding protein [Paenibacillus naphthalenovorans]SDH83029.1 ABC-2 type transport system ATP-binding protein [Paenibacillus naphthalenovorans]